MNDQETLWIARTLRRLRSVELIDTLTEDVVRSAVTLFEFERRRPDLEQRVDLDSAGMRPNPATLMEFGGAAFGL